MGNLFKWGVVFPISFTGFMAFLHEVHFKGGVCTSTRKLDGKTVIITGKNTYIRLRVRVRVCVCVVCVFVYVLISLSQIARCGLGFIEHLVSSAIGDNTYF